MIPFLQFHALAATRGEGLPPEFLDLFKRQAEQAFINPLDRAMTLSANRRSIPCLQSNSPRERKNWRMDFRPTL
jgi:hypothetical protein